MINTPEKEKKKKKKKKNGPWAPEKEKKWILGGGNLEELYFAKKCWYNEKAQTNCTKKPNTRIQVLP